MGDPTMTNILLGAVSCLSAVVAFLYKQQVAYHLDTIKRLSECEEDRQELWGKLAGLQQKVERITKDKKDDRNTRKEDEE